MHFFDIMRNIELKAPRINAIQLSLNFAGNIYTYK